MNALVLLELTIENVHKGYTKFTKPNFSAKIIPLKACCGTQTVVLKNNNFPVKNKQTLFFLLNLYPTFLFVKTQL